MSLATPERLLQRLDWTVIRRLDGILQGEYRSLFTGYGLDLAEIREYTAEDDIRYMDWNVTARMGTPYVRQYHEDREINAWFLLDLSPSVDFGTVNALKRGKMEEASHDTVREICTLHIGIETDDARKIVKQIKQLGVKVQAQIMDNKVRVTGKKIDELQSVIAYLKENGPEYPLQFVNFT